MGAGAASLLGVSGGIGTLGGFLMPQAFSPPNEMTEVTLIAMAAFLAFYTTCLAITWYCYYRGVPTQSATQVTQKITPRLSQRLTPSLT